MRSIIYTALVFATLSMSQKSFAQRAEVADQMFVLEKNIQRIELNIDTDDVVIFRNKGSRLVIEGTITYEKDIFTKINEDRLALIPIFNGNILTLSSMLKNHMIKDGVKVTGSCRYVLHLPMHVQSVRVNGKEVGDFIASDN